MLYLLDDKHSFLLDKNKILAKIYIYIFHMIKNHEAGLETLFIWNKYYVLCWQDTAFILKVC